MKNKLIALSKEKGFKSKIILFDNADSLSEDKYYLWLCELKMWIMRECGLFCSANPLTHLQEFQAAIEQDNLLHFVTVYDSLSIDNNVTTYESLPQALEVALTEGLKLTEKK